MQRFKAYQIGIDQGDVVLFSDFQHDGVMWTGEGSRQARAYVQFSEPFIAAPAVRVGLTLWDFSNTTNTRADVTAEDVTETGFAILFRTWGDTRIARVRVGWQAIGPLRDDEQWEVA
jgi:H-type lectin domain